MVRAKKEMNITTAGKPTEKTGVPQAPVRHRHTVLDGFVEGVPRGVHTGVVDGILTGMELKTATMSHSLLPVASSATKESTQEFGSVPYARGQMGAVRR